MGTRGNLLTGPARSDFAPAEATFPEEPVAHGTDSPADHSSADPLVSDLTEGVRCIQGYFAYSEILRFAIPGALIAKFVEPALPCSEIQLFDVVCAGLAAPPSEGAATTADEDGQGDSDAPAEPARKKQKSGSLGDRGDQVVALDISSDDEGSASLNDTGEEEEAWQDRVLEELLEIQDCLPWEAVTEQSVDAWEEFQNRCIGALGCSTEHFHRKIVLEALWFVDKAKPGVYNAGFDIETWKRDLESSSTSTLLQILKRLDDGIDFDCAVQGMWPKGTTRLPWYVQRIVNFTKKFAENSETSTEPRARIHQCPSQIKPLRRVSRCFCLYEQVANISRPKWETEVARIIMNSLNPHLEFYIMNSLQAGGSSSRCRFYGVTPPPDEIYPKANTGAPCGKTIKELYDPPWPQDRAWPAWAADIYQDGFLKCIRTKLYNSIRNVNEINDCIREAHTAGRDVLQDEEFNKKHRERIIAMDFVPDPAHEDGSCMVLEDHMAEKALGFPEGHLSGYTSLITSAIQRRSWIGDSFCIKSVMHCMETWRKLQADGRWAKGGAVALSLFDGIGGGPVAVHKAGIDVRHWILVEKDPDRTKVVGMFLKKKLGFTPIDQDSFKANQLMHMRKPRTYVVFHGNHAVEKFMKVFNGWSAITMLIGGSPCNNITQSNRQPTYLEGPDSALFKYYAAAVANIHKSGGL
ncbi:DNA (cytosine-5)-methyltransferase, variant 2 [Cymbomonas tetramitiformis]|uniref:DNA (Cytosine-5)-methyltransferase, variant 2 n=2 Tax=Cymbomonas tetramitiformis TaxID=36881 RepID=A0AAE0BKB6_9CHLO|nr:DNA (cytosine-5)-methyltransferase, variant 2 [Cymbomonas tetramitiformis]